MNNNHTEKETHLIQYVVGFSAALNLLGASIGSGWSSPSLPILLGPNSPIPLTEDVASWIVSFLMIGVLIGTIPAVYLMERFGPKTSLLLSVIPNLIGWILVATANSVAMLLSSRIFVGLAHGWCLTVLPIYMTEISSDSVRGAIGVITVIMLKTGVLMPLAIGPFVSISTMGWIALIFPLLFIVLFSGCPETPYYLLYKNKDTEAFNSLSKLHNHQDITKKFNEMKDFIHSTTPNQWNFKEILQKPYGKSLLMIVLLAALTQINGAQSIMAYAQMIFDRIGSDLDSSYSGIILGCVQVIFSSASFLFMDRLGRRPLLLSSLIVLTLCNITLTIYFALDIIENVQIDTWITNLMVAVCLTINACYSLGIATIPSIVLGEVFPKHLKGLGSVCNTISGSTVSFVLAKLFPLIAFDLGYHWMFGIFSIACILSIPFFWIRLPETKNRSLENILNEVSKK